MDTILGIVAGLTHILAFLIYNKKMLHGQSHPNTATWTLWSFLSALNCITYILMSRDLVKGLIPIVSSTACIATFMFSIFKGRLSKLNIWDSIALPIGIFSCMVWWYYRSATYANLILQLCIVISFVPTYRGAFKDRKNESALPWFIWSSAYVLSILVILMRWQGQYQDLAYPINCLLLHGGIGVLSLRKFGG